MFLVLPIQLVSLEQVEALGELLRLNPDGILINRNKIMSLLGST
ncbi:MAG: hypothetical protein RBR06_00470 [Desulfuromonadaceae bacterium]|nr:hypothetical protein [Desulfuromonadaceae bacterium]